jgi:hypothetical protein
MTNQVFNQTNDSPAEDVFANEHTERDLISKKWTKYHTGALIGLPGGILILLGAIFLNIFDLMAGEKPQGIWLFFIIYPLFGCGAHCLDKISEMTKADKRKKIKANLAADSRGFRGF